MNSNAFFSFVLVFAFGFFLLSFNSQQLKTQSTLDSALNSALSLEISSFKRAVAENSTDFLVEKTIENKVFLHQDSSKEIVSAVNSALSEYYLSLKPEGFSFLQKEYYFPNYSMLSEENSLPFFAFTNEFKANVVKYRHLTLVEVFYTGGSFGKTLVFARIFPTDSAYFLLPFNYAVRKLVVS